MNRHSFATLRSCQGSCVFTALYFHGNPCPEPSFSSIAVHRCRPVRPALTVRLPRPLRASAADLNARCPTPYPEWRRRGPWPGGRRRGPAIPTPTARPASGPASRNGVEPSADRTSMSAPQASRTSAADPAIARRRPVQGGRQPRPVRRVHVRAALQKRLHRTGGVVKRRRVQRCGPIGCQATSGIDPPATPKTDPPKKRRMLLKWWVFR